MAYMHEKTFDILEMGGDVFNAPPNHFHVDDPIALPIQALNRKGYTTISCCSGHPNNGYIAFRRGIRLPALMVGFVERENFYVNEPWISRVCTETDFNAVENVSTAIAQNFQDMYNHWEQAYQWIMCLPDFKPRK